MTFIPSRLQYHDNTHSPVAHWKLDGDLTDSSGNGLTVAINSGSVPYARMQGLRGMVFDPNFNQYLQQGTTGAGAAALQITGDLTLEMLVSVQGDPWGYGVNNTKVLIAHSDPGEAENENALYQISGKGSSLTGFQYFAEFGLGTNIVYQITETMAMGPLNHLAMVRASNNVQFYLDGEALGAASTGLSAPTGGSIGNLTIGAQSGATNIPGAFMASVKIIASALTAAQVKAEYNRTIGGR